jgi:phosphatidylserine/phosphatidylglycerophosphate/cardiolipin synthase-like enzyme
VTPDRDEIDRILAATLDDQRLSRAERQALADVLRDLDMSPQDRAFVRNRAFAVAEAGLTTADDRAVVEWLRDVVKLLASDAADERPTRSAAFFSPGEDCLDELLRQLRHARASIDICVFTITDDRLTDEIVAAHGRGVAVRVISDDAKAEDRGSDVVDLARHGVPLRVDGAEAHMHHKFAVFDATTLVTGSFNWTRSATRENQENLLVTDEPRLVRRFSAEFERLWEAFGR